MLLQGIVSRDFDPWDVFVSYSFLLIWFRKRKVIPISNLKSEGGFELEYLGDNPFDEKKRLKFLRCIPFK
jgi:hypothetical protein